jgi:hypothetical protein
MNPFIKHNHYENTSLTEHVFISITDEVPEHLLDFLTPEWLEHYICLEEDGYSVNWNQLNNDLSDTNWEEILLNYYFAIWCKVQGRINMYDDLADNAKGNFGFRCAMSEKFRYIELAEFIRHRIINLFN